MNQSSPIIFDRKRVRGHQERARPRLSEHDFLFREIAAELQDRLQLISRTFARTLVMGGHFPLNPPGSELRVENNITIAFDEESLPFVPDSFDLVVCAGTLHFVNDLVGTLIQIRHVLKPDGLLLAMLPGGETLKELRQSFEQAEMEQSGGISPRVSPFIDVRDAGNLLQRAGFALPVADSDVVTVEYEHPLKLMHDLRGMGQGNALAQSAKYFMPRRLLMQAVAHYQKHFSNAAGRVLASFELVTLTAWKPHESQQQPARRGSGKINLGEALN